MKECLKCKAQFQERRSTAKFCSNKCRAAYNRGDSGNTVTSPKMQQMFNAILNAVNAINAKNGQPPAMATVIIPEKPKEALLSFNELRELIESATSSFQLHTAWKQVEKNKELATWQVKILNQLKENQRTKIDF